MNTVLVVAYHYPPENGTCSEKNVRIAKKFRDSGFKVKVLTGNYNADVEEMDGITVYHTKSGRFHRDIISCDGGVKTSATSNTGVKAKVKAFLSGAAIPDATIDWIPEAKKYVNEHENLLQDVDLIYSISSPYAAHLLSKELSEKTGIPYIMCYGDPWLYEPKRKRGPLRYQIEKRMEGDLIKSAAGVSLITEWNRREYMRLYNIPQEKINTFLIGYEDAPQMEKVERISPKFSMLYGGSLDPVHRNVEPFIKAMKAIQDAYVEIRNNDFPLVKDMIATYQVGDRVKVAPLIPSAEFERLQYKFDALILFGNKTPFQIPGKVFTYISTGKTIVYIKNNDFDDDGTESVLKDYGNTIVVRNNEQEIQKAVNSFINGDMVIEKANPEQFHYSITMEPLIEMAKMVLAK